MPRHKMAFLGVAIDKLERDEERLKWPDDFDEAMRNFAYTSEVTATDAADPDTDIARLIWILNATGYGSAAAREKVENCIRRHLQKFLEKEQSPTSRPLSEVMDDFRKCIQASENEIEALKKLVTTQYEQTVKMETMLRGILQHQVRAMDWYSEIAQSLSGEPSNQRVIEEFADWNTTHRQKTVRSMADLAEQRTKWQSGNPVSGIVNEEVETAALEGDAYNEALGECF